VSYVLGVKRLKNISVTAVCGGFRPNPGILTATRCARQTIEDGETKVVEKETYPLKDHRERTIRRDIWEGALKSAAGLENADYRISALE
jgi:hypothetical protein